MTKEGVREPCLTRRYVLGRDRENRRLSVDFVVKDSSLEGTEVVCMCVV